MIAIDLCQTDDPTAWNMFHELWIEAKTGSDRNARNYVNLKILEHDAFHVLIDDRAIAFAGVYNAGIYPNTIARVLNRAYYARSVRQSGLPTNKDGRRKGGLLSKYVLPMQVEVCRRNRSAAFFSIEFNRRRRTIQNVTSWINEYDRTYEETWEVLSDMYFTCPEYEDCIKDPTCWQNVSVLKFQRDFEFPLQRKTRDEWRLYFSN